MIPTDVAQPSTITLFLQDGPAVYPVPFVFIDADDLIVEHLNNGSMIPAAATRLTLGVDYTVQGGNFDVGQVTMIVDMGGLPDQLRITRRTKRLQDKDYRQGDDFSAESHERALDRLTLIVHELQRDLVTKNDLWTLVASMLTGVHTGVTIKVNEGDSRKLVVTNNYDAEYIRDRMGEALEGGNGIVILPDDTGNKIRISCTVLGVDSMADVVLLSGDAQSGGYAPGGAGDFTELVTDILAGSLIGVGLGVAFDDATNKITITNAMDAAAVDAAIDYKFTNGPGISLTPVGSQVEIGLTAPVLTAEDVRDTIGNALVTLPGIAPVVNDAGDTIGFSTDRLAPDYAGLVPIDHNDHFSFNAGMNGRSQNVDTAAGALEAMLQPESVFPLPDGWATVIRNRGPNNIALNKGAGVVLNKNGSQVNAAGTIAPGGVVQIQRWAADEFTASGPGLS